MGLINMETVRIVGLSVASARSQIWEIPLEARLIVEVVESAISDPWAVVEVKPLTDTKRAVFPCYRNGLRGDAERRRGHAGVVIGACEFSKFAIPDQEALSLVLGRSDRMIRK